MFDDGTRYRIDFHGKYAEASLSDLVRVRKKNNIDIGHYKMRIKRGDMSCKFDKYKRLLSNYFRERLLDEEY